MSVARTGAAEDLRAMSSDVRYAKRGDIHLAYRVVVGNPASDLTVVVCSGQFLPIETMWDDRVHARFLDGLASLGRLIVYDRYGIGLSDPVVDWDEPLHGHWPDDVVAIMDHAGVDSAYILGWEAGTATAVRVAAQWPERVAGLVVLHGTDTAERAARRFGVSLETLTDSLVAYVSGETAMAFDGANMYFPSRVGDASLLEWLDTAGRRGASPSTAARMWKAILTPGRRTDLTEVTTPTLVLWRRDVLGAGDAPGGALEIARELPNAEYVEIPGADLAPYSGDADGLVAEIRRFVTGDPGRPLPSERRIAAVLFTDIVESTTAVEEMGDSAWRGTLDAHDQMTTLVVDRAGGRVVKQTGDGVLAEFPLASQAVAAARELRVQLARIGISIRQGIHVGEVELRGGDISGVAVHLAARLMGLASEGEIVTSASVPLVTGGAEADFGAEAEVTVKGLPGKWATFRVL